MIRDFCFWWEYWESKWNLSPLFTWLGPHMIRFNSIMAMFSMGSREHFFFCGPRSSRSPFIYQIHWHNGRTRALISPLDSFFLSSVQSTVSIDLSWYPHILNLTENTRVYGVHFVYVNRIKNKLFIIINKLIEIYLKK